MRKTAVIGTDSPIGLTVVRELGEHGIPVHAIGWRADSLGGHSRHAANFSIRPAGPIADWLPRFVAENDIGVVMAVAEETLVELGHLRGTIPGCTIIAPAPDRLALVLDKSATLAAARRVGVDVPDSWQPASEGERDVRVGAITYPCAVKWADPVAMIPRLEAAGLPLEKVEYAAGPAQLIAILRKYDALQSWPLVQEYVGGYGLGHMMNMHDGKVTLAFQHRRLREWPPSGGVSTYCASVPMERHTAQRAMSEALLREIGWEGPAMVEYRFDPATGRTCLMEINGRFWGSIPLAYHCGAHFAWESWRCAMDIPFSEPVEIRSRRARYMVPDTKHLAAQMTTNNLSIAGKASLLVGFFGRFLDPTARYYVWSWRDPQPLVADLKSMFRKALRRERFAAVHPPQLPPVAKKLP